jgi:hypothetical protein
MAARTPPRTAASRARIKRGGALPESSELLAALTATTYTFQGDRFLIEPKDQVKRKLGYSPDEADSFVLTFAELVSAHARRRGDPYRAVEWRGPWREFEDERSERW